MSAGGGDRVAGVAVTVAKGGGELISEEEAGARPQSILQDTVRSLDSELQ